MIARALLTTAPLQIVQAALGFATIAAFSRAMSPEAYGGYALVLSCAMLAHTLAFTWAEAAAFRFHPEDADGQARADHYASLLSLIIASIALAGAAIAVAFAFGGALAFALACAAGSAALRFCMRIAREDDRAARRLGAFAGAEIAYLALGFILGLVLIFATPLGLAAPFAGAALAGLALCARDAPALIGKARSGRARLSLLQGYFGFGAPLAAALALDLAAQAGARALLALLGGGAAVGAYAAAFGLARPLDLLCAWIGVSAAPFILKAYGASAGGAARTAQIAGGALVSLALPACVGLALVAEPLATLMLGEGLRAEAAQALPWLAVAGLLNGAALYIYSDAFQLTRRTGLRAAALALGALVQIAACAALAPSFGAVGAAMAACVGAACTFVLMATGAYRLAGFTLPMPELARCVPATAVMALAVLALPRAEPLVELTRDAAFGALVYGAVMLALDGRLRALLFDRRTALHAETLP